MKKRIRADEWLVYPHYEVVEGKVIGFGSMTKARTYSPLEQVELPNALAKVDADDEREILDFVHRYGIVGGSPEDNGAFQQMEPVEWIQEQIRTVQLVLQLVYCITHKDEATAAELFASNDDGMFGGIPKAVLVSRTDTYDVPSGLSSDTPLGWVQYMACAIINSHIHGITRKASVQSNGEIQSSFYFSSLLDVIYWQLLNALEGVQIERCQTCQTPFIKTDGRQRFCPKRYGEAESRCAILHRQRKHLQRKNV